MAVLLCRCCGARLEYGQGMRVVRCGWCGVQQTIPILDFDEKALLWERAEELRRGGEYDRAMSLYEQVSQMSPDDPDVYWAKVLCRYGVEYVEEPVTHKRVPTINRIQYSPVIDDPDYRKAVGIAENGDQRRIYILEAQALDALRKRILSVSLSEKPCDIFICYKESDQSGRRTEDSALAAGLYRALSAEGWRVFFSRITLENKAGTEFEPYIFAALNSARIMLVVGTSPDNMNAVWVKNEWSRYLARMTEKGEGALVPLYKGMLRENLPAEFRHLHAMDMSEPDFEAELIRGIRKLLSTHGSAPEQKREAPADVSGMLRRAELFLEDRDFERADELCERALDCEPENARAYLVKLLAEYHVTAADKLHECAGDFTRSGNYARAVRFADEGLKSWLENEAALAREELERLQAERTEAEKEQTLERARRLAESADNRADLLEAASLLKGLGDYKDSAELYTRCMVVLNALNDEETRARLLRYAEEQAAAGRRKKQRRATAISAAAVCLLTAAGITIKVAQNSMRIERYRRATAASESWSMTSAVTQSPAQQEAPADTRQSQYETALDLFDGGSYDQAAEIFGELGDYLDSREYALRSGYSAAKILEDNGDFREAARKYEALGEFSDSPERARDCRYSQAEKLISEESYTAALSILQDLDGYKDSEELTKRAYSGSGKQLLADGKYERALEAFENAGDQASEELVTEAQYGYSAALISAEQYPEALVYLERLSGYRDSDELYRQAQYGYAIKLRGSGYYDDAIEILTGLDGWSDSAQQLAETIDMKRRDVQPGDIVTLGSWTQGKSGEIQPIEWIVMKREGNRALVTTRYLMDFMQYGALYWKDSSVREWLNGAFYNGAFTEAEKQAVTETALTDKLGNQTADMLFIPNWEEAHDCLAKDMLRTDYSEWGEQKLKEAVQPTLPQGTSYASWYGDPYWLRDIGDDMRVCSLDSMGHLSSDTLYNEERIGVRPAMWIELGEL